MDTDEHGMRTVFMHPRFSCFLWFHAAMLCNGSALR